MNFDFVNEIKDQYPNMTTEERAEWFDNALERVGMSKYFDTEKDNEYNEAELTRLYALRKCTALFKDVFVNGVTPENGYKLADSQRIWNEYKLSQGLSLKKDEVFI